MCDAGCLALSKEIGPEKGLGRVLDLDGEGDGWGETGWRVGRVSQEHGILERVKGGEGLKIGRDGLEVGVKVRIVPVSSQSAFVDLCGLWRKGSRV